MECKEFKELKESNIVEIRSGCIALITRDKNGSCITDVGLVMKYCPFCNKEIKSEYDKEKGYWNWWHE